MGYCLRSLLDRALAKSESVGKAFFLAKQLLPEKPFWGRVWAINGTARFWRGLTALRFPTVGLYQI
jgi:hypothetical protein